MHKVRVNHRVNTAMFFYLDNLLNAPIVLLMMFLIRYADHCGDETILPELPWMH